MEKQVAGVQSPALLWLVGAVSAIAAALSVAWTLKVPVGGLALCTAVGLAPAAAALWTAQARRTPAALVKIWLVMGTIGAGCFLAYWRAFQGGEHYFLTQALGYILGGAAGLTVWSTQRLRRHTA
ncbi:MAG: hypothetical protein Kow00109_07910 [Acidobacteriota bacterium]